MTLENNFINLEGVQGFNYMTVEGNTFWLTEDMAIYEERTFVIVGYVDKIIDSNTFILRLNVGQNLLSGTNISNVANTPIPGTIPAIVPAKTPSSKYSIN